MTFRTICRTDLPASQSPFRVVDEQGHELEWANRFLDLQRVRGLAPLSLRAYANTILHFVRWWSARPGVDATRFTADQFTEATLVDYVRDQLDQQPQPGPFNINNRAVMLRRLFRFYFHEDMPHGPSCRVERIWLRRSPLGYGLGRMAVAPGLKVKVPQRVIVPLSAEEVARFWSSFRTARDLAIVALMLLNGLRSREVLGLKLGDLWFGEAQLRVHGKGIARAPASVAAGNNPHPSVLAENRTAFNQCAGSVRLPERQSPRASHDSRRVAFLVSPSPLHQRRSASQSASLPPHLRLRHDPRRREPARAAASDGPCLHSHHAALHPAHAAGCLRRIRARRGADRQAGATAAGMKRPPHPLEEALGARVHLLATTLRPATVRQYEHTVRLFLRYIRDGFPAVRRASDLRRDPHILGWLEHLWLRRARRSAKPLCSHTRGAHLIRLRKLFDLLADHAFPPRPGLLLSEDIPRPDQVLPRPLTPEDDARLQTELRRRNDLLANTLLLTRLTGMRIGETVDLSADCLHHLSGGDWALHVPLGKLHNERWTPVDEQVRSLVARLRFLATLPPAAAPEFLLPRPKGRGTLCAELRASLSEAAATAGISAHIVPHQLRHTYATSMLRAGVSLPALMKLLGHRTANMTLRYVEITQKDLQREFHQARQNPRYLIPLPVSTTASEPDLADALSILKRLSAAIRLLDLFRQQHGAELDKALQLLLRRLARIRSRFEKITSEAKTLK